MNKLILIALFVGIAFAAHHQQSTKALWQTWKQQNGKLYAGKEEAARFAIFSENVKKIAKLNAHHKGVKFAVNKFADLTSTEFKTQYASGAKIHNVANKNVKKFNVRDPLPDSVDWRNKGAVNKVKDQGQCGSCWAFATTGLLEAFYFINNGKLLSFSEQQIVDCDTEQSEGCNGGYPDLSITYCGKNGLEQETDYPYTARDGKCKYDSSKTTKTNNDVTYVTANSTAQLKAALVNGPVSVAIEADQDVFQFYSSGVISTGCGAYLDHAVLAVGYQTFSLLEAFIVKNSWGHSWGADGYVYISTIQTLNKGQGACGILAQPLIAN